MTSARQIEANRCNATKSTGPKTEAGKIRSRRNAVRHGLSAETVVEILEDLDDYKGFEAGIIADYDAQTAVERDLVLRLASLLWRLRRATAIETELFSIQAEILRDRRESRWSDGPNERAPPVIQIADLSNIQSDRSGDDPWRAHPRKSTLSDREIANSARQLALCFQRIANFDNGAFERLGRYESVLARQVVQTLFLLQTTSRDRSRGLERRSRRYPTQFTNNAC